MKEKYKITCQHCGKKSNKILTGYESQIECPKCKKDMNTSFNFDTKSAILY